MAVPENPGLGRNNVKLGVCILRGVNNKNRAGLAFKVEPGVKADVKQNSTAHTRTVKSHLESLTKM